VFTNDGGGTAPSASLRGLKGEASRAVISREEQTGGERRAMEGRHQLLGWRIVTKRVLDSDFCDIRGPSKVPLGLGITTP
jgi:hypothetical protein